LESVPRREADVLTLAWKKQNPVNKKPPVLTAKKSNVSAGQGAFPRSRSGYRAIKFRSARKKATGQKRAHKGGLAKVKAYLIP
jgi:hypothetical protein